MPESMPTTPRAPHYAELAKKVRILTPTERHWLESADIPARIRAKRRFEPSKLRDLAFDTLIALSPRDADAAPITCDREDFAEIGKHFAFRVIFW